MTQHATIVPLHAKTSVVEPATVVGSCDKDGFLPVRRQGETASRHARMAIHPRPSLDFDDEVLTMTDGAGMTYVVGILACRNDSEQAVETLRLTDGTKVRIDRSNEEDSVQLLSHQNELLLDYRHRYLHRGCACGNR